MADSAFLSTARYAVVSGANKGIGVEVCRQLVSAGVSVVLTSRDPGRGARARAHLLHQDEGLPEGSLLFHQLDVTDPASVASLAQFVQSRFGKLDILVNNAGILGSHMDGPSFADTVTKITQSREREIVSSESYSLAAECFNTNYYGAKRLTEALLPLLRLSDSPRVVNVSSMAGSLKNIPNERVRGILDDVLNLTEDKIDDILKEFLGDLKKGELKEKGWPSFLPPYVMSKAAMTAYTRIMAAKHGGDLDINCLCPGYAKTDINYNMGELTPQEGALSVVRLALLPKGEASGIFFDRMEASSF